MPVWYTIIVIVTISSWFITLAVQVRMKALVPPVHTAVQDTGICSDLNLAIVMYEIIVWSCPGPGASGGVSTGSLRWPGSGCLSLPVGRVPGRHRASESEITVTARARCHAGPSRTLLACSALRPGRSRTRSPTVRRGAESPAGRRRTWSQPA